MPLRIALYQPDIPQNTGSFIRLAACMGVELHIIEPCGFVLDDKALKRVMMDYGEVAAITRHSSWEQFLDFRQAKQSGRLLLLTTRATMPYTTCRFEPTDYLLFGRESSGVPEAVHSVADERMTIPMHGSARSLNVVLAASMVLGEALRQING